MLALYRKIYVIEYRVHNNWYIYGAGYVTLQRRQAIRFRERVYKICKGLTKKWTRKDFRIALYERERAE